MGPGKTSLLIGKKGFPEVYQQQQKTAEQNENREGRGPVKQRHTNMHYSR